MTVRRVAVTGLSLIDPQGESTEAYFARLLAGQSAITLHTTDDPPNGLRVPAVRCTGFDPLARLDKPSLATMDRYTQLGVAAAFEAWDQAGLPREPGQDLPEAGVAWGSALGGTLAYEQGYRALWFEGQSRLSPLSVVQGMNNAASAQIGIHLGLGNASLTYTVACASAATAIGEAFERIRHGQAKIMVAGGSDAPLAFAVIRAWEAMRVLAPGDADTAPMACRPFHAGRRGLVLAEAAAALILEDWAHAEARGAPILAELVGYGVSTDHSHLVRPDAAGQVRALRAALDQGGLRAADIGYVNAHGTATREGDPTEIAALRQVFGAHAETLPVSATKSMHGHGMGATGAVEAVITVLALQQDALPPTAHLTEIDPACAGVLHLTTALRGSGVRAALSNAFAFGGSNAVLAFKAVHPV
ncbi:beta-ketoacyl-[acyl-carrier-protein] synthase family protein [Halothiobacillus sp. DCM-1]|uniref:beta-ketoacyl-[acyl-carrier-protein] synthase family protein n=1 Tax=Halothiobacillus sp. DCM-1 TaxID=3112558 RepID=UPI00325604F2